MTSEYSANLLFSTTMIKIQDKFLSSCGKLLLLAQTVLKAVSFFSHTVFSIGQVYISIMLLHLLNSFRFLVQAGETMYVPEAGDHQGEQQMTPFSGLKKKCSLIQPSVLEGVCNLS